MGPSEGKREQMNQVFYMCMQNGTMKPIVLCKCFCHLYVSLRQVALLYTLAVLKPTM